MGGGLKSRGVEGISGFIANVNSSGQLAVEAVVNVGAVSAGISGQTTYIAATEISGTNPLIYVTQSGQPVFEVPHRLIVAFSGDTTISKISGETVTISNLSGVPITTSISGNTVIARISGQTVVAELSPSASIQTSVSGNVVDIQNQSVATSVSGNVVSINSGAGVRVSGETIIGRISGETVLALISGQTVVTEIDLSGVTLNVDNIVTDISGQIVRISAESGRSSAQLKAYDYSGLTWNDLAVDNSGSHTLKVAASVTADISGQTVRTFAASGQNAVYITNQSGNVAIAVSGTALSVAFVSGFGVRISGETISLTSGTGVRISGETVAITSGAGVRISGETISLTSGAGVRISGEVVNISGMVVSTSGGVARVSGEVFAIWQGSGRNGSYLVNRSGTLEVIVDASGRLAVTTSGVTVISKVSGEAITISGNVVSTSVSGNTIIAKVSGETMSVSVSGNIITAAITVSGNTAIDSVVSTSGRGLLTTNAVRTTFFAYQTLQCTSASGGEQLLSGDSQIVSIRNIGQSGSIMFLGSSGTNRAPYVLTEFSGWGWQLKDGDSMTVNIKNPNLLRVVSLTSGQPISYAISNW